MKTLKRSFSGDADKILMTALARKCFSENLHVTDLTYRLSSWALDEQANSMLWFNEDGKLVGWSVMQNPFWTIDIVCDTSVENKLYPQILAWANQRATILAGSELGLPSWFVNAFSGQIKRIHELEKAGFICQADLGENSWSKVLMKRPGSTPVKAYTPPKGFIVRPLAGEIEVDAYVKLHRSVFESKNMTSDWRLKTLRHPAYQPDLDIVVQSPDGRLVAFCICWLSEDGSVGQIEPLGCHKEFRNYGLGRVALAAGLNQLHSLGVQEIYVETDSYRNSAFRLYESFDFQVIQDVFVYGKNYEEFIR